MSVYVYFTSRSSISILIVSLFTRYKELETRLRFKSTKLMPG